MVPLWSSLSLALLYRLAALLAVAALLFLALASAEGLLLARLRAGLVDSLGGGTILVCQFLRLAQQLVQLAIEGLTVLSAPLGLRRLRPVHPLVGGALQFTGGPL